MSRSDQAVRQFPDWILTESFIEGAVSAQLLNDEIGWTEPEDCVGAYKHEDGYVFAVSDTESEFYYSEVTLELRDVK